MSIFGNRSRGNETDELASDGSDPDEVASDPQHRVVLDPHLGITEAPALHDALTKAASQGSAVTLDGSSVDRIHTPAMQLLIAFRQHAESSGLSVRWEGVSQALRETTDLMGLSGALGIPPVQPTDSGG